MFINKIKGCLYGYAIGDALGIGTEFMTRREVRVRYPEGLKEYSQIIRDAHRSVWKQGQVSHDTEVVLMMARSFVDCGRPDHMDYAARLKRWFDETSPSDLGAHIRWVLKRDDFVKRPLEVSHEAYDQQGLHEPYNEALGRAMVAGLWPGDPERHVLNFTKMTHWDQLAVASAMVVGVMANELLWHRREADPDRLAGVVRRFDRRLVPYMEVARNGKLSDFELDDEDTLWSAPKTVGAAMWLLWHVTDPSEALDLIIAEGGDADTNAALTLGLMGLKYGYSRIPERLVSGLLDAPRIEECAQLLTPVLHAAGEKVFPADDE
ncbi:MAG: ADP-ribosylglycohydrolase family protein [Muribaculaceae bacterium]|nr:ADP-ribosylglycohydrolase family protein [Muribaculaceae bacterium]